MELARCHPSRGTGARVLWAGALGAGLKIDPPSLTAGPPRGQRGCGGRGGGTRSPGQSPSREDGSQSSAGSGRVGTPRPRLRGRRGRGLAGRKAGPVLKCRAGKGMELWSRERRWGEKGEGKSDKSPNPKWVGVGGKWRKENEWSEEEEAWTGSPWERALGAPRSPRD